MAGAKQLVDERLRIADVSASHPLLELPHVASHDLDEGLLIPGQRGDDGVRQIER